MPRTFEGPVPVPARSLLALLPFVALLSCLACGGTEPKADSPAATSDTNSANVELEFWQSVKDSGDPDQLLAYIKKYPEGQFVELAESRLKGLSTRTPASETVASTTTPPPSAPPPAPAPPTQTAPPPSKTAPSAKTRTPSSGRSAPTTRTRSPRKTAPSSGSRSSRRGSSKDQVLDIVDDSLDGYRDPRLHVHPHIPQGKANNAASVHGIDRRDILVLYDDGLMGGGKTGFVITDSRVYWRFVSGSDPYYIDFGDIRSAIPYNNKLVLNGYDVGTTMSSNSSYAAEVFADLMLDLRDEAR